MKTRFKGVIRWILLTGIVLPLAYCILLIGNPYKLEGKFSSYELFPHDKCDVIEFDNGMVTHKTCCGNSYYGYYMRKSDGPWIWYHQSVLEEDPPKFLFKKPVRIQVERHLFSLTLRFEDGKNTKLPRRLFTSICL